MTQPIGAYRRLDPPDGPPPDPPDAAPPNAPPSPPRPGSPSAPARAAPPDAPAPDAPSFDDADSPGDARMRLLSPGSGFHVASPYTRAAAAAIQVARQRDANIQGQLDAFRNAMTATYHTPDGDVPVAATFAMSARYPGQRALLAGGNQGREERAALACRLSTTMQANVEVGRGSPEAIHAVTQALIDRGYLSHDPAISLHDRVRSLMFAFGLGVDCAGYVQQAYARATGARPNPSGGENITNEALMPAHMASYQFRRIEQVGDVRPGDIVLLGKPANGQYEHRAIVYSRNEATATDLAGIHGAEAQSFAIGGPIDVLQVDSSWGCGGDPLTGGVERRIWWYNEQTRQWASQTGSALQVTPGPYGHPLEGFYRRDADMGRTPNAPRS